MAAPTSTTSASRPEERVNASNSIAVQADPACRAEPDTAAAPGTVAPSAQNEGRQRQYRHITRRELAQLSSELQESQHRRPYDDSRDSDEEKRTQSRARK